MIPDNLALLPPIKRARGYRLYTEGKRFVDLYLDGGRAVLGHNPPNVLREMKNAAERSLFAPYPSYYKKRFEKALSLLFPGKSFMVYGSMEAVPSTIRDETPEWRPYMECGGKDALVILPHSLAPAVLAVEPRTGLDPGICYAGSMLDGMGGTARCRDFPPLYLSPVVLALTTRAIYDVLHSPERGAAVFGQLDEALADGWARTGIYVRLKEKRAVEEWARIFRRFLDAGFLVPPTQRDPLILPGELSGGEEKALAECLREPKGK